MVIRLPKRYTKRFVSESKTFYRPTKKQSLNRKTKRYAKHKKYETKKRKYWCRYQTLWVKIKYQTIFFAPSPGVIGHFTNAVIGLTSSSYACVVLVRNVVVMIASREIRPEEKTFLRSTPLCAICVRERPRRILVKAAPEYHLVYPDAKQKLPTFVRP